MNVSRASWIGVIVTCVIAALALALNGYTGYAITVLAVGLAGAINL